MKAFSLACAQTSRVSFVAPFFREQQWKEELHASYFLTHYAFFRCFELLSAFFELSFQVLEDWLRDRNNNKITNDTCSESLFDKAFAVKLQKLFPKLQPLRKKVGKRGMVSIRAYRPPAQNTKEYSSKIFPTSIKLETLILVSCSGWCICSVGRSVIRQLGQSFLRSLISRKSIVRIILHFFIPSVRYHIRLLIRW